MGMQEDIIFFSELVKLQISMKECLFMCVRFGERFLAWLWDSDLFEACVWCAVCTTFGSCRKGGRLCFNQICYESVNCGFVPTDRVQMLYSVNSMLLSTLDISNVLQRLNLHKSL